MADQIPALRDFSRRLWLAGGRDQIPNNALRRCVGAAGDLTPSVVSSPGSSLLYAVPNVISLTKYSNVRFQYDGLRLFADGAVLDSGYSGGRLAFAKAPPQLGIVDYLFLRGGGKQKKLDPLGNLTNWGIDKPLDGMNASLVPQDLVNIDTFDTGSAANWTPVNCTVADQSAAGAGDPLVYSGTGSAKIVATGAPWQITRDYTGAPLDLAAYANGDISLETDIISFWVYIRKPTNVTWLWLLFDVDDGTFKNNYYRLVIQVVSNTANVHAANADIIIATDADRWVQVAAAKSVFERIGAALQQDWSNVVKIRFQGGNLALDNPAAAVFLDQFQMFGGCGIGAGPAAIAGGSTLQYLVTFGNDTTGNDSNPNDTPLPIYNVAVQAVQLNQIPVSSDPQVTNRKLWRTSEGGALFSFLDIIHDNVTTSYVDKIVSLPGQPIATTPWQMNALITAAQIAGGYYIDMGNGFYAKETAAGPVTTGAIVPTWNIPNSQWSPLSEFDVANITILPLKAVAFASFKVSTPGISGMTEPNWALAPALGNHITDGTVIWVNNGPLTTNDNTAVWATQAINALPTLGLDTNLEYDNIVFPLTATDAVFFQGSMFVTRDSSAGNKGNVYISPPGRSEGYGVQLMATTDDDPIQKAIVWDEILWLITSKYVYPLTGVYPDIVVGDHIQGSVGTDAPFTVIETPEGIVYSSEGFINTFSRSANGPLDLEALDPIFNGRAVENVAPFSAIIAEHVDIEDFFSDGNIILAYNLLSQSWRIVRRAPCTALYYEDDTGVLQAAIGANVVSLEDETQVTDLGIPIPVEWQTGSFLLDATDTTLVKRVWIDVALNGQQLVPTLLMDNNEYPMPIITGAGRTAIPIPFQRAGKLLGIRLVGALSQRVEWFGLWPEVRTGRDTATQPLSEPTWQGIPAKPSA